MANSNVGSKIAIASVLGLAAIGGYLWWKKGKESSGGRSLPPDQSTNGNGQNNQSNTGNATAAAINPYMARPTFIDRVDVKSIASAMFPFQPFWLTLNSRYATGIVNGMSVEVKGAAAIDGVHKVLGVWKDANNKIGAIQILVPVNQKVKDTRAAFVANPTKVSGKATVQVLAK